MQMCHTHDPQLVPSHSPSAVVRGSVKIKTLRNILIKIHCAPKKKEEKKVNYQKPQADRINLNLSPSPRHRRRQISTDKRENQQQEWPEGNGGRW